MSHNDFRYVSEAEINRAMTNDRSPSTHPEIIPARGQGTPTPKSAQAQANELSHRAATLCWQISSTEPVANWKARIEQAPEELRECLREFLAQKWRERQDKAKRQAARDSEAAKQAMAEASALVAKL